MDQNLQPANPSSTDTTLAVSVGSLPFDSLDNRKVIYVEDAIGKTVADIIGPVPPAEKHDVLAVQNGELIEDWSLEIQDTSTPLYVEIVPKNREILSIVGIIAVAVFAPAVAGLIATKGTFLYSAIVGAVSLLGNAIVGALFGAEPPGGSAGFSQDAQRFGIRSTQNRLATRRSPVLCVMGTHRVTPYFATAPYVYVVNSSTMGFRGLYDFGIGPLDFQAGSHKFGSDPVSDFSNAVVTVHNGSLTAASSIAAYPDVHDQQQVDIELAKSAGWVTIPYPAGVNQVDLLIVFNGLFSLSSQGAKEDATVEFEIQAKVGSGAWTAVRQPSYTAKVTSQYFASESITFATTDAGQIRIRRTTDDTDSSRIRDIGTLRYVDHVRKVRPVQAQGRALVFIQIHADRNLNNVVSSYNAVVTRRIPTWTKASGWGARTGGATASNPAWLVADLMRGPGLHTPLSDDRVDAAGLADFASYCTTRGYRFDGVWTDVQGLWDRMNAIAAAGRASITQIDGTKYGVLVDRKKTVPIDLITPKDTIRFRASKQFDPCPHGFRASFNDRDNDYMESEIVVYAPDYSATGSERDKTRATDIRAVNLAPAGVTTAAEAHKYLQYLLAVKILRPESFEVVQDIKNLRLQRGDYVDMMYDTVLVGLGSSRLAKTKVSSGRITQISLDEFIDLNVTGQSSYSARFQTLTGTSVKVGLRKNAAGTVAQQVVTATPRGSYV